MRRYRTEIELSGRRHETYREAESAEDAAAQAARAWYLDATVEHSRDGQDLYGPYREYTARSGYSRIPTSVRVRE